MSDNDAPAAAESKANRQLIDALRRSRMFRDYGAVFSKATGIPLALRPLEYWQLAHRGKKNENPFCALLAQNPATLSVCLQAHEAMIQHTGDIPNSVTCPFGLTETAVPLKLAGKTIGYLRIGQVLRRSSQRADTEKTKRVLADHDFPFTAQVRRAWEHNPLIPSEKYGAMVRLLTFFADQLSSLANQLMVEKKNAEPPIVQKARAYLSAHKSEPLALTTVATASGASVSHFCKVFRRSTGLTFTDYVARIRLEDARTQLVNPNRRVSEIAYDVGFQSLTQFNRTFKRVFGQSPTEFRAHVSSGKRAAKS